MEDYKSKEEKRKKMPRRRDRLWNFLFQDHKQTKRSSSSSMQLKRTPEQTEKINYLSSYAKRNFSISLDPEIFERILENNDWDQKKAVVDMVDYEEASHGILVEPPKDSKLKILGSENDAGTSCYIDSLLFAMYISNTAFDPLLTYDIPLEQDDKVKMQTVLRLFVNKLRKGHFINSEYVHWFREALQDADWNGQNEFEQWTQEDASELFLFITQMFELPYLPFQIRLFHGGNKDSDDDRVMTDRTVTLCIPDDVEKSKTLQLQDILVDYFYNSIVTGVKRQVDNNDGSTDIFENVAASPSMAKYLETEEELDEKEKFRRLLQQNNERNEQEDQDGQVNVTAWQVLELLPFYSAINEQGEAIQTQVDSSFPDTRMILPIVLKRYKYDKIKGGSVKIKNKVEIPVAIDFNKFVNRNADDPMCPTCGHLINWTLHFKSAVCHKGDSPLSGHYISYARVDREDDGEEAYWLKFDDMNASSRTTYIKDSNSSSICSDLAENAYIIFYELDKTCRHGRSSIGLSSDDENPETKMVEIKSEASTSTHETEKEEFACNCKAENSKYSKHKHHHHHHHKYHLKESCSLM